MNIRSIAFAAAVMTLLPGTSYADVVEDTPVVPTIGASVKQHISAVYRQGSQLGNRSGVFAKVGDSITASDSFLKGIACDEQKLGDHQELADIVKFFKQTKFPDSYTSVWCGTADSFSRNSASATEGWTVADVLGTSGDLPSECGSPFKTPLKCEFHLIKPATAIIMFGTNDLERVNRIKRFKNGLTKIVRQSERMGVIPVLSTIPPRLDSESLGARVTRYNRAIVSVAKKRKIPLVNYWKTLKGSELVNQGMDEDGIHPNLYGLCREPIGCQGLTLTDAGLRYGYNQRNLTVLQALEVIKKVIFNAG